MSSLTEGRWSACTGERKSGVHSLPSLPDRDCVCAVQAFTQPSTDLHPACLLSSRGHVSELLDNVFDDLDNVHCPVPL